MADPILVPCLVALRGEFNIVSPGRDRRSDGWIGDRAHRLSSSDHNPDETGNTPYEDADNVDEVHGLDIDDSGPWPSDGWFDRKVDAIVHRHYLGHDDRLQNVIRNGLIASRSWGWTWRKYTGQNGHFEHAHFSSRYTTAQENDTSPWGVAPIPEDIEMTAEFFESVDRAIRNDGANAQDRTNRDRFARAVRFSLGLEVDDQTSANLPCGPAGLLPTIARNTAPAPR